MIMKNVAILGVPIDLGAESLGVDIGPDAFRDQKIIEKLTHAGFSITDIGNIDCQPKEVLEVGDPKLRYLVETFRISEKSAEKTFLLIQQGENVVALGGDHSLCLGVISGASVALKGQLGLIYLDAHGDMNTPETTLTGNIHGMPLAALMEFGDKRLIDVYKPVRKISKVNMLHIGGNDFDPGELAFIEEEQLQCFKTIDMLSEGLKPLFERIKELSKKNKNIWVSLDLDVIDEIYAPGVGMPNKAGFTYREITAISEYIGKCCHVVGVDIAEYNPLRDVNGKTAELGIELIAKLLGGNYSWYTEYMEKNRIQ